jgi:hypothetical protein
MRFRGAVWASLAAVVAAAGCGDGLRTGDVSGTVTFDGTPVKEGAITFFPRDGAAPTRGGFVRDGKYAVNAVPLGEMKVVINGQKVTGTKAVYPGQANSPIKPVTAELLPPKYSNVSTSELRYEVKPGSNEKNFDLGK